MKSETLDLNIRIQKVLEEKGIDPQAYEKISEKKIWKYFIPPSLRTFLPTPPPERVEKPSQKVNHKWKSRM